jgi:Asp-tRNA(Asn)/Glu-tRNA(Gln) amidotransferase C subunit
MGMVTEAKKAEIHAEVHTLLKKFAKTLDKLPVKKTIKQEATGLGMREEGAKSNTSSEFKERMLANAPKTDCGCIVAEKGAWI